MMAPATRTAPGTRAPTEQQPSPQRGPDRGLLTVDQRGTARPQGTAWEAGATEVNLDGSGGLPVTGAPVGGIVIVGVLLLLLGVLALLGALAIVLVRRQRQLAPPSGP